MAVTVKFVSKVCSVVLLFIVLLETIVALRMIQTELNPGCDDRKEDCAGGVAYIKAIGEQNTFHYILTAIGPPTFLVILTEKTTKDAGITINWDNFKSGNITEMEKSIKLDPSYTVLYSYGVVFTRLFQYNDTEDKAELGKLNLKNTAFRVFDFSRSMFEWYDLKPISSDSSIKLRVKNSSAIMGQTINNGSLEFKFSFFDHMDRAKDLPHLQYTEDTSQFDFTLKNIDTGNMSLSRFALESVLFSTDSAGGDMKFDETKSIDDEYTPGVFKISNWLARPEKEDQGGFLQHKPVCYTKPKRGRAYGTYVRGYGLTKVTDVQYLLDQSAVLAYFGSVNMANLRISSTNFSFGLTEDGTFTKTNYTVWTGSIGYGKPPMDVVSSLVVVVISVGLGIPVVLILFGGLFVCLKKKTDPLLVDVSKNAVSVN
ncbi:unnamed protein product [Mytilus coruscus]|uniref:Lysosomal protein NCU-G1 n=1 Tax=Mytilus coruscus TaxID=42192 RepID=A0A6J8B335_MYTCO|nr:unnamed protein product [Mytilus coruscus]